MVLKSHQPELFQIILLIQPTQFGSKRIIVFSASISEKLVSTVFNLKTSKQVWDSLQARFSSTSRSRIALLKRQLQTLVQGNRPCSAFLEDAKLLADQLTVVGKPVVAPSRRERDIATTIRLNFRVFFLL